MKLQLITLNGAKLSEEVYEVVLPTASGQISVYPGHETLVTLVTAGMVTVRRRKEDFDENREIFAINGGVAEISPEAIRVLVDDAEAPEEIVTAEAEAALARANEMRERAGTAVELNEAYRLIEHHTVRLKVANIRRHKHR